MKFFIEHTYRAPNGIEIHEPWPTSGNETLDEIVNIVVGGEVESISSIIAVDLLNATSADLTKLVFERAAAIVCEDYEYSSHVPVQKYAGKFRAYLEVYANGLPMSPQERRLSAIERTWEGSRERVLEAAE